MNTEPRIELYYTPALPRHYIAVRGADRRLLPDTKSLEPIRDFVSLPAYRGNYDLTRIRPLILEDFCQPR